MWVWSRIVQCKMKILHDQSLVVATRPRCHYCANISRSWISKSHTDQKHTSIFVASTWRVIRIFCRKSYKSFSWLEIPNFNLQKERIHEHLASWLGHEMCWQNTDDDQKGTPTSEEFSPDKATYGGPSPYEFSVNATIFHQSHYKNNMKHKVT